MSDAARDGRSPLALVAIVCSGLIVYDVVNYREERACARHDDLPRR